MHQPLHHLVADAPRDDAVLLDRALDTVLPAMLRQGPVVAWVPAPVRTVPAETLMESLRPEEPSMSRAVSAERRLVLLFSRRREARRR